MLGVGNQQELSTDLESDPFLNTALQRFTCDLYYCFGALLAPVSVGIITGKHYAKKSITKAPAKRVQHFIKHYTTFVAHCCMLFNHV